MANALSVQDIKQIYENSLLIYNHTPVYVELVSSEKKITLHNLVTQKKFDVPFDYDLFSPPKGRIGYVNIMECALYVCRTPVRRMSSGLTHGSLSVKFNGETTYNDRVAYEHIRRLKAREIATTMFNIFPSKEEAIERVQNDKSISVAFDRQFAVKKVRDRINLYYRGKRVGTIDKLDDEYKHLASLLENGYAKKAV